MSDLWLTVLIVLYVATAFFVILRLLLYGVRPSKTLGWLLAIFTIPVGGVLLFLILGRNRRKNKLYELQNDFFANFESIDISLDELKEHHYQKIIQLIDRDGDFPMTRYNKATLLKDGKETFTNIFKALESAKEYIHLQYYIFEEGELAEKLLVLFEQKIKEGVTIRLLYDGIGSFSLSNKYKKKLANIGVEAHSFLPFQFGRFLSSVNYRNHRKIIVIDNQIGFTGGLNISDKYLKQDATLPIWHDMHLRMEGEAVAYLDRVFILDWYLTTKEKITLENNVPSSIGIKKEMQIQIAQSGPDDDFALMEQVYFAMINEAEKYVYIINPYLIPNHALLQSLQTAALSGVDVRLLMSSNTDMKLVDWCVRAYFESYGKAGIRIFLYPKEFLHSKVVVCDDQISSIGTANLDDRSLHQNYEVNAIIYDELFAKELKAHFLEDCAKAIEVDIEKHNNRPWTAKLIEGFAKLFSPLL
ncbi:MAG: cardiolipin synthase [Croceitalea sp.]|nr:cardiolipin synthase [Croceitalea sp.]